MDQARLAVTRWPDSRTPSETLIREQFEVEGLSPYSWSNGPNFRYAPHQHPYHKVLYCVRGGITFRLEATGEEIELRPGDRLDLPPGTLHSAVVGPWGVVCMEAPRHV